MSPTNIEWTHGAGYVGETWNPLAGCSAVSTGCDLCYAATLAATRLAHLPAYAGLAIREPGKPAAFTGKINFLPERLSDPLTWRKPRMVFVNSMSDLFHADVLREKLVDRFGLSRFFLAEVLAVMAATPQHVYQVLTKRPQAMATVLNHPRSRRDVNAILMRDGHPVMPGGEGDDWPKNIWLGASIEDDRYSFRADHVRATPAAVRFLSLEPLLGPLPRLNLDGIDWVIVGGESGPGARPMDLGWARDLVGRCRDAGVPVFVKQLGTGWTGRHQRDLKGGHFDTFPPDLQVREMPRG